MYLSRRSSSDGIADLTVLVIILAGVVLFFTAKFLAAIGSELYWLYMERGTLEPSAARRILQAFVAIAAVLACVLGTWLVVPAAGNVLVTIGVWSTLAFVLTVEAIEHRGRRHLGDPGSLATYLPAARKGEKHAA
jgi:hypothetical protein